MEDATNDPAILKHVIVVVAPTRGIAALESFLPGRRVAVFNGCVRRKKLGSPANSLDMYKNRSIERRTRIGA